MQRLIIIIILLLSVTHITFAQDDIISNCPTLAHLSATGQIEQVKNPVFTDQKTARNFAVTCSKLVKELDSAGILPGEYLQLRQDAALAAEFLTGETYLLSTSNINSVVTLRRTVKIPPPDGFIYVKKYRSIESMPPEVSDVFHRLSTSDGAKVQGVTIRGRYIAMLNSEYQSQYADNLAHEMVHAYITLVSPSELPKWFQEGAAVYFSIGTDNRFYTKKGDMRIAQVTIPEDYKRKLYTFQHIEEQIGKPKLYAFVRKSVVTGDVDARSALGLKPAQPEPKPSKMPIYVFGGGMVLMVLVAWIVQRRRDDIF